MRRTELEPMPLRKQPVHHSCLRDRILVSQRAVAMKKGIESTRMLCRPIPAIDLLIPSPRKQTKATTTHKGERWISTKREPAKVIRAWVRRLEVL